MNECLFRKCQLQGLRSRQKRSLLIVNEYFGGKRNEASGTLWTDTNYAIVVLRRPVFNYVHWFIRQMNQ